LQKIDACYSNKSECEKITDSADFNFCYLLKAQKENRASLCEKTRSDGGRHVCYQSYARNKKDCSVCDKLTEYRDICRKACQ